MDFLWCSLFSSHSPKKHASRWIGFAELPLGMHMHCTLEWTGVPCNVYKFVILNEVCSVFISLVEVQLKCSYGDI